MKKICASCKTDRQVKFYDKGKTEFGTFKIGWSLCSDCYEREVSLEHDRQLELENEKSIAYYEDVASHGIKQ